jgi:hypothetical protein
MLNERTGLEITYGFAKYGAFVQGVLRQCIKCSTKEGGSSESESDSSDREESESRLPVGVRVKS